MTKRLREFLESAVAQKAELERQASANGGFAYQLALDSLTSHIDDLTQQIALLDEHSALEIVELRLRAPQFHYGSTPLRVVSKAADAFRQLIGYAALRVIRGEITKKRVPQELYNELDLRLSALLSGSSRMVITASANRDLFDDGVAKTALERFFTVLATEGTRENFLESVTDLGPQSCKRVREFVDLVRNENAEIDLSWRHGGGVVREWVGTRDSLDTLSFALAVTEVHAQDELILEGTVELLSKRERIHLRTEDNQVIRILFPKRLLPTVAELHLDQTVRLRCAVSQTLNPFTNEQSTFYDLISVVD